MAKEQFNFGLIVAVNLVSPGSGGTFSVDHINGLHHAVGRAVVMPGTVVRGAALSITNENGGAVSYPTTVPFDVSGIASFPFKWDASGLPMTMAEPANRQIATRFWYSAVFPRDSSGRFSGRAANLLWFSNIADINRLSSHFKIPGIPITAINNVISRATGIARPMYTVINPVARASLAALILLK